MPLVRKDGLPEKAREIVNDLKFDFPTHYEGEGFNRKALSPSGCHRYSLLRDSGPSDAEDNTVTLRERDSMEQKRVNIDDLHRLIHDNVSMNALLRKLG